MKSYSQKSFGFTLIELLVVIAIIGLLSTLGVIAFGAARAKAKTAKAQGDIDHIVTALKMLENDTGFWPGHQPVDANCGALGSCPPDNELCGDGCLHSLYEPFSGLTADDSGDPYPGWSGPYVPLMPLDPWGHEYFFDSDYDHATLGWSVIIGSYGPDGVGNNLYNADDIVKKIY